MRIEIRELFLEQKLVESVFLEKLYEILIYNLEKKSLVLHCVLTVKENMKHFAHLCMDVTYTKCNRFA